MDDSLRTLKVDFTHIDVKLDPGKRSAQVKTTASLAAIERSGRPKDDTRDVDFLFRKDDGWRIASVTVWEKH